MVIDRRRAAVAALLLLGPALATPARAEPADPPPAVDAVPSAAAPGASVDELLAIGRALSPAVAAKALDAEAAQARVDAAGRFPDPMFTTEFEDMNAARSYLPESLGRVKYSLEQTIPLWGKLGLEERVARAEAGAADAERRAAEVELDARIKTLFAGWYATEAQAAISRELLRTVAAIASVAQRRYAQGQGGQQDAVAAETEAARLQLDLVRLEAERRAAAARMNALLDRPAGAPLTSPRALRPLPGGESMTLPAVLERARQSNPGLDAEAQEIAAAERTVELVRRTWYPDLTFGVSVYDEEGADDRLFGGYEAMVAVEIPLQWGLRLARERDAVAKLGASRARRDASAADLRGEVEAAWWALDAARRGEEILRRVNLPQADALLRSALAGYELGRSDLPSVLLAEQGVRRTELERITLLVEQQVRLAELEKLIGGDL